MFQSAVRSLLPGPEPVPFVTFVERAPEDVLALVIKETMNGSYGYAYQLARGLRNFTPAKARAVAASAAKMGYVILLSSMCPSAYGALTLDELENLTHFLPAQHHRNTAKAKASAPAKAPEAPA